MTAVIINPGTGPVWSGPGSVLRRNAERNIRALCRDAGCDSDCRIERDGDVDGRGWYPYRIFRGKRSVEVDMPGLALEKVRYIAAPQNPWDFPRLYVDGSSWLWSFAIDFVRDGLGLARIGAAP